MSEQPFRCPECGDEYDASMFIDTHEFAEVQLGCRSCPCNWIIGADIDDFYHPSADGDSR